MRKLILGILMIILAANPIIASHAAESPDETDDLLLVNKEIALPEDYVPSDLRAVNVTFPKDVNPERTLMRKDAATALETMFEAAKEDGISLIAISGYRSYASQKLLYNSKPKSSRDQYTAKPGHSEHQTGLAMDLGANGVKTFVHAFADSKAGKWIAEHAHEYGFIIRYPKDAEDITGYKWEPWHVRYIGNAAPKVVESGGILETYLIENATH